MGPLWSRGKTLFTKSFKYAKAHKFISAIALVVVVGVGWWAYAHATSASAQTRYVLGTAQKGTIVSSISASGQVSASNQLDIKPKVSGEVIAVGVKPGAKVKTGDLIVQLDATDALKSVRDAKANLESTQIAYEKLQQPASTLSLTQAQNELTSAQDALTKLYSDSTTDVINTFLDLPDIVNNVEAIQIGTTACGNSQWNLDCYTNATSRYDTRAQTFRDTAQSDFVAAKTAYNAAFADYQALGNAPDQASIEKALSDAYSAVQLMAKATKSTNAFIQLYEDVLKAQSLTPVSAADTALGDLNSFTGKLNTHLSTLLSDTASLKQDKQSIVEKQESLDELNAGTNSLDLRSSQLSVTKAQNALQDAQNTLANYYVRAPFDGTIAAVDVKKYDTAGSGSAVATLITSQKIAQLSLNEVDVAKVQVGDKATLTFDAIDGLTLTGEVAEIDTIGTVSQGVVSYTVKIGFDSQDDRIKSGMTVNASIQTDIAQDVLMVPSSAVKTQNNISYVEVFTPALQETGGTLGVMAGTPPEQVQVETGISDDTNIEIKSGLTEGEQVVVRTSSGASSASSAATRTNTTNRGGGGFGGGGQVIRL